MPKIAFVGAGSATFTRRVLSDLFAFPEFEGRLDLALHDIDDGRLRTAAALAQALSDRTGVAARIETHLDRRKALDGADYVINEIQVGGYAATLRDFEIPASYGLRQTIADTIGIGGIFRGLRTIPVLIDIARDMQDVSPDGWLLNYTNPMAMIPWAIHASTSFRNVMGLCHSVRDTHAFLAGAVGRRVEDVDFLTAGLNHQAFVMRFEENGRSLYPDLDAAISEDPEMLRRVRVEVYRRFGYFPTESSEHLAEYVPWFLRDTGETEHFRTPVDEYLRRSQNRLAEFADLQRELESGTVTPEPADELAPSVIHSLETGTERVVYGNVVNDGLIPDLPAECTVEVPCAVGSAGIRPQAVGARPPQLVALNRTFLNVVELTVRAVLEERRDHVLQAALLDPNTAATLSTRRTAALVDELIAAHGDLLPAGLR